jgi:hypothetical protein
MPCFPNLKTLKTKSHPEKTAAEMQKTALGQRSQDNCLEGKAQVIGDHSPKHGSPSPFIVIVLPLAAVLFILGWSLCCIGRCERRKAVRKVKQ